jgi:hypothetical protein
MPIVVIEVNNLSNAIQINIIKDIDYDDYISVEIN